MTSNKLDYGDWLVLSSEMMDYTLAGWINAPELHDAQAAIVLDVCKEFGIRSMIEVGCGAGHLAKRISDSIDYVGLDKSLPLLDLCRQLCPNKPFVVADIRNVPKEYAREMSVSFATLKHFSLNEWDDIFAKIVSLGEKYTLFEIPNPKERGDDQDLSDDDYEFPHVWISRHHIDAVARSLGREIVFAKDNGKQELVYLLKRVS